MKARLCDRCGSIIKKMEPYINGGWQPQNSILATSFREFDLCKECGEKFKLFLKPEETEQEQEDDCER